jgi:hypothetical protein
MSLPSPLYATFAAHFGETLHPAMLHTWDLILFSTEGMHYKKYHPVVE